MSRGFPRRGLARLAHALQTLRPAAEIPRPDAMLLTPGALRLSAPTLLLDMSHPYFRPNCHTGTPPPQWRGSSHLLHSLRSCDSQTLTHLHAVEMVLSEKLGVRADGE